VTKVKKSIKIVIQGLMNNVMDRVLLTDPFIEEEHQLKKPLYAALVPDEIFKGSHFERRFVTPFGGVWEKLAIVVAVDRHGVANKGVEVRANVRKERLRRIQEVLNRLEHKEKGKKKTEPNWAVELAYILEGAGELIPTTVVCDILIDSQIDNKKYAFELKAPLPNSDQTKVSKEKMFKLLAMEPKQVDHAYFALPYNPYGKKEAYNWGFPKRWFNMTSDESVLIGDEFWELIGGAGTYQFFIEEVNGLGKEYKERIYREFLEMEVPVDIDKGGLK
jgi:hypothetical protein